MGQEFYGVNIRPGQAPAWLQGYKEIYVDWRG